ncbi:ATP-binding protein [Mangrovivirga sp. M17]|uniref:histidine kinase n=1 Tax=Mangrovivirga halotolerans TaxID=2993936 RepID=A0ABT3RQA1_9BACT|nr:PAS domain-containing sensor histidine kinase [Mangrovivirga halotolerans]MCX2743718.1 ATP-binding protein [Mangrovivirga halotolerans]
MTHSETKYADIQTENEELKKKISQLERELYNSKYLNKSEQFLKSILDCAPTAIVICEPPDGRITYINDAVWAFRGKTDARLTDITVKDYVHSWKMFFPDGRQYTGREMPLARSLYEGEVIKNEQSIVELEDGKKKWVAIWSAPIFDHSNKIIGAIVNFHDITEEKKLERRVYKNEKRLNNLLATKDKFFSIITHDLRSPFNSVLGLANLLEKQIEENDLEGIKEYSYLIKKSTNKAIGLLENLIQWSRAQSSTISYDPEKVNLKSVIPDVISLLKYSAKQKSIDIYCDIPDKSFVHADTKMLRTILRNLISNGIKFTRKNGEMKISVDDNKENYLITISDNGIGIPENVLNNLFKIEKSISTPGTQNETGTGLGLILCKEFVKKHGGEIWVESKQGKGTKFKFTIPKKPRK